MIRKRHTALGKTTRHSNLSAWVEFETTCIIQRSALTCADFRSLFSSAYTLDSLFPDTFEKGLKNKHCRFHVCIISNQIDLCGVTRQAGNVRICPLYYSCTPESSGILWRMGVWKGAVIDSLKLKQMSRQLLACQWLRTRCGMKNSPQKGKKWVCVKSIRPAFNTAPLYSSTWKRIRCFGHKSAPECHGGWLWCSSRNLLET